MGRAVRKTSGHRDLPRPSPQTVENYYHFSRSRAVFALWHGQHKLCRLLSASVPPCALGMMWSTVFASRTTPARRHNWHRPLSRFSTRARITSHFEP
ncbi:hypothetical protein AC14_0288 [Escherichia coli 2-052-05_S3_C2]|nr:hypothetical protein AC14_0288 [Escherichia coli 2-052-05_S3_C2]